MVVRRWAVGGVGLTAVALVAGATWYWTGLDELHVVATAGDQAGAVTSVTTDQALAAPSTTSSTTPEQPDGLPSCSFGDETLDQDPVSDWATALIDTNYALSADFEPPDLVEVSTAGFDATDKVRQIVVDDLSALRQAAEANGTPLVLVSGYRSYIYQAGLYADEVALVGEEQARRNVARPGHSEHQLGTTVDLLDPTSSTLDTSFAETPAGQWLAANAHRYGFVLSYPEVPQERSCYVFEPWHVRYVGRDMATDVYESGLSLREWLLTAQRPSG
jgi:D-alanyl-D-alanine carboxypeptidase